MRVELSRELVIGGYTSGSHGFNAVLVGSTEMIGSISARAFEPGPSQPAAALSMRSLCRWTPKRARS